MKNNTHRLVGLSVFHCVNDGSLVLFASALPVMRVSLGLSLIEIGTVLSLGLVATMLLQLLFGSLSDHGYGRVILLLGFAGIVAADLVFPVSSSFLHVLVFYVFLRSAAGVYHPVSFSSIGRTYAENKTTVFGYQGAIGDLGIVVATFSTGILSQVWGWKVPFWTWGMIGLVLFAYFATTIIRYRIDFRPQSTVSHERASRRPSRSLRSAFAAVATVSAMTTTTFTLFTGYMPLYFNIAQQFSPGESTTIVALWVAVGVLAGFGAGALVKRLGGETNTLRTMFAIQIALLLVTNVPAPQMLSPSLWQIVQVAALVTTGVPVFAAFPAANGLIGFRMPHSRLGLTYALNLSLGLLTSSVAAYIAGYMASVTTIGVMLPVLLIVAVLGAIGSLAV